MDASSRTSSAGPFDVFDEISEMLLGWKVPGGPSTGEVLQTAGLEAHTRLLDLGCGTGRLLARAARMEPSAVLVGIDNDQDSIEIARERARSAPAAIELHVASAEHMPFADDYFDVVTSVFVIGGMLAHVRARALAETRRVLKALGEIIVVDWTRSGCLVSRLGIEALAQLPSWSSTLPLSPGRAEQMLAAAGFEETEHLASYCTIGGSIQLSKARKPLVS